MTSGANNIKPSFPTSRSSRGAKAIFVTACLCVSIALSGCSSTTLPWPDLSVSSDEADGALNKEEQSLLDELLTDTQKNHDKDAVREIEGR